MPEDRPRPKIIYVDQDTVVKWQPPRYGGYLDLPIYHIKAMSGKQRAKWVARFTEAQQDQAAESNPLLAEKVGQTAIDEQMINFVGPIENVPGKAIGLDTEETVTVMEPAKILKWINSMPADDQLLLDRAIWHIATLEAGEVKNSEGSPKSHATPKGEPTSDAEDAPAS